MLWWSSASIRNFSEGFVTTVQAAGDGDAGPLRRQMLEASARRTADALSRRAAVERVFDFRPLARKAAVAAVLLGAIARFRRHAARRFGFWLQRMRLTPELWPRRVALSVVGFDERDGERVVNVARDDSFDLQVLASITDGHEAPPEVEVRWRLADGRRGRGPMLKIGEARPGRDEAQLYQYAFKVTSDVVFDVIGGDDRIRNLRLHPVERPAVRELALQCDYPAYLQRGSRLLPVASGRAELPEGSTAFAARRPTSRWCRCACTTRLSRSTCPVRIATDDPAEFDFDLGRITGDRVLMITMHDADGVENRDPFRLADFCACPMQPPEVNVQLRGIGTAVTPQARIPLAGRLTDDYATGRGVVRIRH